MRGDKYQTPPVGEGSCKVPERNEFDRGRQRYSPERLEEDAGMFEVGRVTTFKGYRTKPHRRVPCAALLQLRFRSHTAGLLGPLRRSSWLRAQPCGVGEPLTAFLPRRRVPRRLEIGRLKAQGAGLWSLQGSPGHRIPWARPGYGEGYVFASVRDGRARFSRLRLPFARRRQKTVRRRQLLCPRLSSRVERDSSQNLATIQHSRLTSRGAR